MKIVATQLSIDRDTDSEHGRAIFLVSSLNTNVVKELVCMAVISTTYVFLIEYKDVINYLSNQKNELCLKHMDVSLKLIY